MFAIIQAAGWPIWPLLLASIIAVALIIERSITLRGKRIVPPSLLEQVVSVYQRQGVSEEGLEKLGKDSPLGTGETESKRTFPLALVTTTRPCGPR